MIDLDRVTRVDLDQNKRRESISTSTNPQNIVVIVDPHQDVKDPNQRIKKDKKIDTKDTTMIVSIEEDPEKKEKTNMMRGKTFLLKYQCHQYQLKSLCQLFLANKKDEGSVPDPL